MKQSGKKQTFLGGAFVLAVGTAIVKVIGLLFKVPLNRVIGEGGFGYFTTAYDIYSLLLIISTAGLPVAMSRMISEARALGRTKQIQQIYKTALIVFLILGIIGSGGMIILCKQLADWMEQPNAWFAILCLAPALFFIGIISAQRGYFQGQGNMTPTSVSQVFEALSKLIIGLGAAFLVMKLTNSVIFAAGSAIIGITLGTVISAAYLSAKHRKGQSEVDGQCTDETVLSFGETAKSLLAIAIPITIGAACLQLISLIDAKIVMHQLNATGFQRIADDPDVNAFVLDKAANLEALLVCVRDNFLPRMDIAALKAEYIDKIMVTQADVLKGIYNFTQTIFNLPCAFITPLTISAIPAITECLTKEDKEGARKTTESAIRVMGLIAIPCSVGLAVLAEPIVAMLGGYTNAYGNLTTATWLMAILGIVVIFNSFVLVSNAILQAHKHVVWPVINMVAGGIVKIVVNYFLVGTQSVNIIGAPIGTLACYITITVLNIITMRNVMPEPPKLIRNLWKTLIAAIPMGAAAFGANYLFTKLGFGALLRCGGAIAIAGVVYIILVLFLRIITKDDCELLPKGDKIAKILKIH